MRLAKSNLMGHGIRDMTQRRVQGVSGSNAVTDTFAKLYPIAIGPAFTSSIHLPTALCDSPP